MASKGFGICAKSSGSRWDSNIFEDLQGRRTDSKTKENKSMIKAYFDWNLWSEMAFKEFDARRLSQRLKETGVEVFISPMIIAEMCQADPGVIEKAIPFVNEFKRSPILRDSSDIEVNQLLSEVHRASPSLVRKDAVFNCSIFGDGNSVADNDWQGLVEHGASIIDSTVVEKLIKNKWTNSYLQTVLRSSDFSFEETPSEKIDKILELAERAESLSGEDLKLEVKRLRQEKPAGMILKWSKYSRREKTHEISRFCKSELTRDYLTPLCTDYTKQSQKFLYFEKNIVCPDSDRKLEVISCITEEIDLERIPCLWIAIVVAILQESQRILESNVYDQKQAAYLQELDHFVTCDDRYYSILSDSLMERYLKSMDSNCKVSYLDAEYLSEMMIASAIS